MSFDLRAALPRLYPLACEWAQSQFELITRDGAPLTEAELDLAHRVGVQHPEKVRILEVVSIPLPTNPTLRDAGIISGLFNPQTEGLRLTMRALCCVRTFIRTLGHVRPPGIGFKSWTCLPEPNGEEPLTY
jgi:hypothetical protein